MKYRVIHYYLCVDEQFHDYYSDEDVDIRLQMLLTDFFTENIILTVFCSKLPPLCNRKGMHHYKVLNNFQLKNNLDRANVY